MPEELRQRLLAAGHSTLDLGPVTLALATGKITRTLILDGKEVATVDFPDASINWLLVSQAIDLTLTKD